MAVANAAYLYRDRLVRSRRFDAEDNLRDWWAPGDAQEYEKRAARLVKQFDAYVAIDDLHVNGRLTLGEKHRRPGRIENRSCGTEEGAR